MAEEKQGESGTGWMYNPNAGADKEDYLLGKKVDKNFEGTLGQLNAVEYDCAPPSIFASKAEHQVDLQRKLLEDPLVAIKKREVEDRKRLLDNPVKMKALQEHIESLQRAKAKKKKKKKKKKHKGSDSDDSDTDLDLKLLQRLQKMEGREQEEDRKRFAVEAAAEEELARRPKYTDKEEEPDTPPRDNRNKPGFRKPDLKYERSERRNNDFSERRNNDFSERRNHDFSERRNHDFSERRKRSESPVNRRQRSRTPERRRRRSPSRERRRRHDSSEEKSPPPRERKRQRSISPQRNRKRHDSSEENSPPAAYKEKRRQRSNSRGKNRRRHDSSDENSPPPSKEKRKQKSNSPKPARRNSPISKRAKSPEVKKEKLDDDEKARRLAEMMSNAVWRDEQRTNKVNKYREKDAKEQEQIKNEHDPEFLQRELRRAAASSSVEGRIKSNKHNIQRGVGVMDKNFAKR